MKEQLLESQKQQLVLDHVSKPTTMMEALLMAARDRG